MHLPEDKIVVVWQKPFAIGSPRVETWPEGTTLTDIIKRIPVPAEFKEQGVICINDHEVPKQYWSLIKPKPSRPDRQVTVTLHLTPQGGRRGGSKQVFALIAAISITILSQGAASGWFATSGGLFAQGTVSAYLLSGAISLVGALIVGALTAPPSVKKGKDDGGDGALDAASAQGNILQANAPMPRVIGRRRIYPPFVMEPLIERVGLDEYVYAVAGLAGPHHLSEIRLGEHRLDRDNMSNTGVSIEIRQGLPGEPLMDIIQKQSKTLNTQMTLTNHTVDPEDQDTVVGGDDGYPSWHGFTTRVKPDEVWIHLDLRGLVVNSNTTQVLQFPLRLRMRPKGADTWVNLPELHYKGNAQAPKRFQIKLRFGTWTAGSITQNIQSNLNFFLAYGEVPQQDVTPISGGWSAGSYFMSGSGDTYLSADNVGTTQLQYTQLNANGATFYLNESVFDADQYEFEVRKGMAFPASSFTPSNYQWSNGSVYDFFGSYGSSQIRFSQEGLLQDVQLTRVVNIWNENPIPNQDQTLIAMKAKNTAIEQLSVLAEGFARVPATPEETLNYAFTSQRFRNELIHSDDIDRTSNFFFGVDVEFTDIPQGIIWEQGSSGTGLYLGVTGSNLVFRAGNGSDPQGTNGFKIAVPVSQVAGKHVTLYGAINLSVTTNAGILWMYDHSDRTITQLGTANAGVTSWGPWADTEDGRVGRIHASVPVNEDETEFNGWIGSLRLYENTTVTSLTAGSDDWNTIQLTRNPAAWYYDVLAGDLNLDPMPESLIDGPGLIEWYHACASLGYHVDLIAEGSNLTDILQIIASCGYARPYQSEVWSVIRDYDRSAESPVQIFTPRNAKDLSWSKAFPRLPAGLRVNYIDALEDYVEQQLVVYRQGMLGVSTRLEQTVYEGMVEEDQVKTRAEFDLKQAELRSTYYDLTVPVEWIRCRRGSLVGLTHSFISRYQIQGRILDLLTSNGKVTGFLLDQEVEFLNSKGLDQIGDISAEEDLTAIGVTMGALLRKLDGTIQLVEFLPEVETTAQVSLTTPLTFEDVDVGCLLAIGPVETINRRMLVSSISPGKDLEANLTLVDEAPELWE